MTRTQLISHGVIGGRYTKRFPIVGGAGGLVILRKYSGFYNVTHAGSGLGIPGFHGDLRRCRRLLAHALRCAEEIGFSWEWTADELGRLWRVSPQLRLRLDYAAASLPFKLSRAARRRWREGRVWL